MKITFNTGRLYSAEGQIITAEHDRETDLVTFEDHSRMIAGKFKLTLNENFPLTVDFLARRTMTRYDNGMYQATSDELARCATVHQFRI